MLNQFDSLNEISFYVISITVPKTNKNFYEQFF